MKPKLFYLKYSIETHEWLLDVKYSTENFCYGIRKHLITQYQAELFVERIDKLYIKKNKDVNLNILEFEFDNSFHICYTCGKATYHDDWYPRYKTHCYEHYLEVMTEMYKISRAKVIERERLENLKEYLKTEQGKADLIGLQVLRSNIIIQLRKHSKTQTELAVALGVTDTSCHRILYDNLSIKVEYLYKISEFLLIPIDLLLKSPRGLAPLKKKNNIPICVYRKPMRSIK